MGVLFNIVGICGVCCVLLAYFWTQSGKINSSQLLYPVINLIGSVLILISLFWTWNLPSFIIEVCWIAISLYGIFNIIRKNISLTQTGEKE